MQKEITQLTKLLKDNGNLNALGYSKKMNIEYNKEKLKFRPFKLKEWNFYQFIFDHYSLQMTIGHVSYMSSISATLIDLNTQKKYEIGCMKPLWHPELDLNPEKESLVSFKNDSFEMVFETKENERILSVKGSNKKYKNVEIKLVVENDLNNEKMVISTPFKKKHQFYLNYKENYYKASGYVKFDELELDIKDATGLIDWGRGIWPYKHEWFWGNLTSFIDGVPFGFNIGWGFGDLSNATENMFFYNKKCYKLGKLIVERDVHDYMKPWRLKDENGLMELYFTPFYDNYTENKYVVIDTHCDQLYGYYSGYIFVDGKKIEFNNILAFIEHAVNKW